MQTQGKVPKDDKWKEKYREPEGPDTADLPELPEGWVWATIEQLASEEPRSIQSGPFGSNLLHSEFQDTGVLAIGIDNVLEGLSQWAVSIASVWKSMQNWKNIQRVLLMS